MNNQLGSVIFLVVFGISSLAQACINDSKTLWEEKHQHPTLAQAILSPKTEKPDVKSLTEDLQKLKANPKTNDAAWWNDLAGAYLRLGQPAEAVKILEPLTNRFAADYGVHANLGTAYHLLGRYADAEKEIRRDLEINPDAHFGFEKYHLALLQYLSQDESYRARHVYVEEFTYCFLTTPGLFRASDRSELAIWRSDKYTEAQRKELESKVNQNLPQPPASELSDTYKNNLFFLAMSDAEPGYMEKWDLGKDSKLDEGVVYMATLNTQEPACQVMLGMVALKHRDINLARAAFNNAIQLGSPQAPILRGQLNRLEHFHSSLFGIPHQVYWAASLIALVIAYYLYRKLREFSHRRRNQTKA